MATMETSDSVVASEDLDQWSPVYPDCLQDLQTAVVREGCKCATTLDDRAVNGAKYEVEHVLRESFLGAVVERSLKAERHLYHQHVYPFQLVGGFTESEYIKKGEWHDTFEGRAKCAALSQADSRRPRHDGSRNGSECQQQLHVWS